MEEAYSIGIDGWNYRLDYIYLTDVDSKIILALLEENAGKFVVGKMYNIYKDNVDFGTFVIKQIEPEEMHWKALTKGSENKKILALSILGSFTKS